MKLLNEMNEIALVRPSNMSIISKKRQNANYKAKQYSSKPEGLEVEVMMKLYFNLVDICWKCRTHSIKTEMAVIKLIDSSIVPSDVLTEETKHFVERKIDLHFS